MQRRPFLGLSAAGVALAASAPEALAGTPAGTVPTRLLPSGDALRALLNQRFHVVGVRWHRTPVELVELIEGPNTAGLEQFTAIFEQAVPGAFLEGIHHLVHDAAGRIDLFLKALPRAGDSPARYEASFCLLV